MRERGKFSNRKRGAKPSKSTGARRAGEKLRRSGNGGQRRRDRKSSGGNLFALFGLDSNAGRQRGGRRKSASKSSVSDRLVSLQSVATRRSAKGKKKQSSRAAGASVIPLHRQVPSARSRRRTARRQTVSQVKQNLVQLPTPQSTSGKFMLYGTRLLVLGVGIGVLAGTVLSIWDPASHLSASDVAQKPKAAEVQSAGSMSLGQELSDLKGQITTLVSQQKAGTEVGVMLVDLDSNAYVDVNASVAFPAASTIKFPILVAFFQDVDSGKIRLSEMLEMRQQQVAKEAGSMQYQPVGTKFSAIDTATRMMVESDNTATNMLIDRLGGQPALNQRFKQWGLTSTVLRNPLPDIAGTNITTPKDLAGLMGQVQNGDLIKMKSRDRLLGIMRRIENDTLLPRGLDKGATIAHKTGTLGILLGDIGLIDTPTGKRYLASVLVKRPRNDAGAQKLIHQISRLAYQRFNQVQDASQRFKRPRIAQPLMND